MAQTLTEEEIQEMFEDMEYNDRMMENRAVYDGIVKRFFSYITACLFMDVFVGVIYMFPDMLEDDVKYIKLIVIAIMAVNLILHIVGYVKKEPLVFIFSFVVYILFLLIFDIYGYVSCGVVNVALYILNHNLKEARNLEGYPHFAYRNVRHKI